LAIAPEPDTALSFTVSMVWLPWTKSSDKTFEAYDLGREKNLSSFNVGATLIKIKIINGYKNLFKFHIIKNI
jgi:hypothetical protein